MKKMLWLTSLLIGVFFNNVNSQDVLTLEDVISGGKNYRNSIPDNKDYSFRGFSDELLLNEGDTIFSIDNRFNKKVLITIHDFNKSVSDLSFGMVKSFRSIHWINDDEFWVKANNFIVIYNVYKAALSYYIQIPADSEFLEFNGIAKSAVFIQDGDLKLVDSSNQIKTIERAENTGIVLGKSVHRNEFGIYKGIFWSPSGRYIAFYRKDETMVSDYPLVNINKRVAELEKIKYPMAGMKSHHVTIGVYNINNGIKVYLKTGEPKEKYLTNVSWSSDEANICVAELNREQNHMNFNVYNASDGQLEKLLFEEESTKWVEPENEAAFLFNEPDKFIWQSERDGFNHLYLYSLKNGLIKQITKGNWVVTGLVGIDAQKKNIIFESTKDGVMNRHLYMVSIKNGTVKKISEENGFHYFQVSKKATRVIDSYSNFSTPRKINILDLSKRTSKQLFVAENPFKNIKTGQIKLGTIHASDGKTELNYRMVLPVDFNPEKKYPVIVYVYGGPHSQLVSNSWLGGVRLWQMYMAQKGYIAFTMDNRGTNDRGCEFEQVIHRRLGEIECSDQFEGIKFLKELSYVDSDRIGVHGWSFGGFMTINLMEKYPEVFKVGVAGGPVTDWKLYEIMYGERYMDMPDENPEGYNITNIISRVDQIKGRLLVIHGAIDPTVVWQHSLQLIEESVKKRVQLDYFVYPRHEHNVLGSDRVHLMEKVTRYFDDFLK